MGIKLGFYYVPYPQAIWDEGINLSHNGYRMLGYLSRHTLTFGHKQVKLTDDEFLHGRIDHATGQRFDKGCGIKSKQGLINARAELLALGWVAIETDKTDKARIKRYYSLVVDDSRQQPKPTPTFAPKASPKAEAEPTPKSKPPVGESPVQTLDFTGQGLEGEVQSLDPTSQTLDPWSLMFRPRSKTLTDQEQTKETDQRGSSELALAPPPEAALVIDLPIREVTASEITSSEVATLAPTVSEVTPEPSPELATSELTLPPTAPEVTLALAATPTTARQKSAFQELMEAVVSVRKLNMAIYQGGWGRLAKECSPYYQAKITAPEMLDFGHYWYSQDFRGIKNEAPLMSQIAEKWETAKEWSQTLVAARDIPLPTALTIMRSERVLPQHQVQPQSVKLSTSQDTQARNKQIFAAIRRNMTNANP